MEASSGVGESVDDEQEELEDELDADRLDEIELDEELNDPGGEW